MESPCTVATLIIPLLINTLVPSGRTTPVIDDVAVTILIVPFRSIRTVTPSTRTVPRYEEVAGVFSAPFILLRIFCFDMNPNDIYSSDPNMLKETDEVVDFTDITSDADNDNPIVKNNESDG